MKNEFNYQATPCSHIVDARKGSLRTGNSNVSDGSGGVVFGSTWRAEGGNFSYKYCVFY